MIQFIVLYIRFNNKIYMIRKRMNRISRRSNKSRVIEKRIRFSILRIIIYNIKVSFFFIKDQILRESGFLNKISRSSENNVV